MKKKALLLGGFLYFALLWSVFLRLQLGFGIHYRFFHQMDVRDV